MLEQERHILKSIIEVGKIDRAGLTDASTETTMRDVERPRSVIVLI